MGLGSEETMGWRGYDLLGEGVGAEVGSWGDGGGCGKVGHFCFCD